jgi:hypothetical protein
VRAIGGRKEHSKPIDASSEVWFVRHFDYYI